MAKVTSSTAEAEAGSREGDYVSEGCDSAGVITPDFCLAHLLRAAVPWSPTSEFESRICHFLNVCLDSCKPGFFICQMGGITGPIPQSCLGE